MTAVAHQTRTAPARPPANRAHFRWFRIALPVLLCGYLFFGRPFAYLHVPGIPVYPGEVVLLIGVIEALRCSPAVTGLFRRSAPAVPIALFCGYGALRLAADLPDHGLMAVRDSAMWYYATFAVLVAVAIRVRDDLLPFWLGLYRRVIPLYLLWFPIAVVLARSVPVYIRIPDAPVHLFEYKPGDYAVAAGAAVAFLWLVDRPADDQGRLRRLALTVLGAVGLLVAGTQNRAGLLAAAVMMLCLLVFTPARSRLVVTGGAAMLALLALVAAFDVRIPLQGRELSLEQLGDNLASVVAPERTDEQQLVGTVAWRQELWTRTATDVLEGPAEFGFGFGPNLAARYGFGIWEGLRNPHNSHLTVLARMGMLGALLWVLLWSVWYHRLLRMVWRRRYHGPRDLSLLAAWCVIAITGLLINAAFDPSLEGPQAGIWLWTFTGLGLGISARRVPGGRRFRAAAQPTAAAT
ncbi:MAG TPA: O-antigen ligase family protein [Egibacteraceae bacterium]|nr:O-antigen ligase family protein [Egibacteraceae bacterium]